MHSYLTQMKIQNFVFNLNCINFIDIQEHWENIKMKFVNLRLEVFSQKKQNTMNFYQRICQKKLWGWFCVEETDYFSESKTV